MELVQASLAVDEEVMKEIGLKIDKRDLYGKQTQRQVSCVLDYQGLNEWASYQYILESTWELADDREVLDYHSAEALKKLLHAESSRVIGVYEIDRTQAL